MWSMDLLATWSTAVQSARRQALTLRRTNTTIPIHGMTMRFHQNSRGTNNFDKTTTAGEYDEQSGYDSSEYDDNDLTLGGDTHLAKEQQRSVTLAGDFYSMSLRSSKDQALWWRSLYRRGATRSSDFSIDYIDSSRGPLCRRGAARTCCICDHERRGRTSDSVQAAVNVDAWGRVYCSM